MSGNINFASISAYVRIRKINAAIERSIVVEKAVEDLKSMPEYDIPTLLDDRFVKYVQDIAVPNTVPHIFGCYIDDQPVIVHSSKFMNYNEVVRHSLVAHELTHFILNHNAKYSRGDIILQDYIDDDFAADANYYQAGSVGLPVENLKNNLISTLRFLKHSGFDVSERIKNLQRSK